MSFSPESFCDFILSNTLRASALIVCILLLRLVAGARLPAQCFHLLWIFAAVRLLTPLGVESSWSLFNFFSYPASQQQTRRLEWQTRMEPANAAIGTIALPDTKVAQFRSAPMSVRSWLGLFWLTGIHVQIALLARSAWRMRCSLRTAVEIEGLTTLAHRCALQMGLKSAPRILETAAVSGPAVMGLWKLRLLLPIGLKERLSDEELRFVLLHECAHLSRADLAALWLLTAARILHWFNPLVWVAARLARTDVELACDETVMRNTSDPFAYGQALLKLAQSVTGTSLTLPSIGIAQNKHSIRIRLTRIGLYSPSSLLRAWLPASLILAATGFGFGFDEKKPAPAVVLESIKPSSIGEKPSWVRGWSVVRVEIPDQAKLMDAYVTFKTPSKRLVRLARGITSNEGVSIDTIQWSDEPLEAQVIARKESEVAKFDVEAALVSSSDTLKPKSSQIEFESKFIELSDADAKALRIPSPAPNTVRVDLGTLAPESANVLYEGAAEKLFDGVAFTGPVSMSAPRITTRSRQKAVIEIIRELRYASEYKANPDATGPQWIPSQFEVRNTGITLEVEPVLDENDVIQIKIVPQVVEFQGYIDINTRIPAGGPQPDSSKSLSERMVTPFTFDAKARILPVFSVRKVSASVLLRSGQSVLFVGLRETEKLAPFKPSYAGKTLIVVMTARTVQP